MTLRMLKQYAVLGKEPTTRDKHKKLWELVEKSVQDGSLPSIAELDGKAPFYKSGKADTDASRTDKADADTLASSSGASSSKKRRIGGSDPIGPIGIVETDALGGCAEGVPKEVHARMLERLRARAIPKTCVAQRCRSKLTGGTSYRVPPALKEALRWHYIHPDLAPPEGMVWKRFAGGFTLAIKGG